MYQVLPPGMTLDKLKATLESETGRKVMVVSSHRNDHGKDCLYRYPDETVYSYRSSWELFSQGYTTKGLCVGKEETNGQTYRHFDLTQDPYLQVIFEAKQYDTLWHVPPDVRTSLDRLGLPGGTERFQDVRGMGHPLRGVEVSNRRTGEPQTFYATSSSFLRPEESREQWSTVDAELWSRKGIPFKKVVPPGMYPKGMTHEKLSGIPCFALIVAEPGQCYACNGASGETVHFTTQDDSHNGVNVCRACFRQSMAEIAGLLDRF